MPFLFLYARWCLFKMKYIGNMTLTEYWSKKRPTTPRVYIRRGVGVGAWSYPQAPVNFCYVPHLNTCHLAPLIVSIKKRFLIRRRNLSKDTCTWSVYYRIYNNTSTSFFQVKRYVVTCCWLTYTKEDCGVGTRKIFNNARTRVLNNYFIRSTLKTFNILHSHTL